MTLRVQDTDADGFGTNTTVTQCTQPSTGSYFLPWELAYQWDATG